MKTKTKKKKSSKKKAAAKKTTKMVAKNLSPEEKKTRLKKLHTELGSVEDQKEKKNIRAKMRATDKNWKGILGIKSEAKGKKKTTKKTKAPKKTTKKKSSKKTATA